MPRKTLLLFLLMSSINFAQQPPQHPRRIEATFSFQMVLDNEEINRKNDLKYWNFLPGEWENQKNVQILEITPEPKKEKNNKSENFISSFWDFSKEKKQEKYTVQYKFKADVFPVDNFIDPATVPDVYSKKDGAVRNYLGNDSLAFITQEIIEIAHGITRNVSDPFLKARNAFRWVLTHMEHHFPVTERGTRYLLANPHDAQHSLYGGDSAEYTWLFVALCRAVNVPARPVVGFLAKQGWESPHTWAEFYLPELGWIPADPFVADSKEMVPEFSEQFDQYFYLGHLDTYHVIIYKGTQIELNPKCSYSFVPFVKNNRVWYAPVGIWNFEKLTNVNSFLHVDNSALLVEKFIDPEHGVEIHFSQQWLQSIDQEKGPYFLKVTFWDENKTTTLDLVGRELPASQKDVTAEQAAHFEIDALKKMNQKYKVHSGQSIEFNELVGYKWTAYDGDGKTELRYFFVKGGNVYWFIASAEKTVFDKNEALFEKIMASLKIDPPKGRKFK